MPINISNIEGVANASLYELIVNLLNWFISFSAVLSVIMIISAGFQYIMSVGDEEKIRKATLTLVFAILGMVLVFLAPLVIQYVIDNFLN